MLVLLGLVCVQVHLLSGLLVRSSDCGSTRGCIYDCSNTECDYIIYWRYRPEIDSVDFSMNKKIENIYEHQWFAVGFSSDRTMGDDSVIDCTTDPTFFELADVKHSYNHHHYNIPVANSKAGLRHVTGRVEDGVLTCNFTRTITVGRNEKIFDLDRSWYLFVASGYILQVHKSKHTVEPSISPYKVDLREHKDVNGERLYFLVKLHGCLMVFSWMLIASIGIIISRYFREAWPNGRICGRPTWYQTHRLMMMTAALCVIASFVIIWYDTGKYAEMRGANTFQRAHPVLGVVVMGLTILNPVLACLKTGSGTLSRPVFKYAHGFIGTALYMLAVLNIALGTTLKKTATSSNTVWLVVAFGVYQFVIEVILEIHNGYLIKTGQRAAYEMKQTMPVSDSISSLKQDEAPGTVFKKSLLAFHVVVVFGVSTTCIFLVAM